MASSKVIRGSSSVQRQADEQEYVKGQGWVTYEVWEGVKTAVDNKATELESAGYDRISIASSDNIVFRLRAALVDDAEVNTWEIHGSGIQEDIFSHNKVLAMNPDEVYIIKKAGQNVEDFDTMDPQITSPEGIVLWHLVKNNQISYQRGYYILRQTITTATSSDVTASLDGVEMIVDTSNLPSAIDDEAPGVSDTVDGIIGAIPFAAPTNYKWGWLKQAPTMTQSFGGRLQITQEWWFYCWSTFIYDTYTPS